jgi:hypothetical protein
MSVNEIRTLAQRFADAFAQLRTENWRPLRDSNPRPQD